MVIRVRRVMTSSTKTRTPGHALPHSNWFGRSLFWGHAMTGRLCLSDHAIERIKERFGSGFNAQMAFLRSRPASKREMRLIRRYEQARRLVMTRAAVDDLTTTAVDPETQAVLILARRHYGRYSLVTVFRMPTHRDIAAASKSRTIYGTVNGQ